MAPALKILSRAAAMLLLFTTAVVQAQPAAHPSGLPAISCLDVALPITFSWVSYDEETEEVPAVVAEKVQKIIVDFYISSNGGNRDDLSKAKDSYFQTLRVPLNNVQLFIVILKTPLSYSHCKLFLYDSAANTVSKTVVDYNTWAMYSIDDNGMKRSDLFKEMQLNSDDITLQKKQSNLLVKRLKHDGTLNELEEITYHPNGVALDTVSFKSKKLD